MGLVVLVYIELGPRISRIMMAKLDGHNLSESQRPFFQFKINHLEFFSIPYIRNRKHQDNKMRIQQLILLAALPVSFASSSVSVDFKDGEQPIARVKGGTAHCLSDESTYHLHTTHPPSSPPAIQPQLQSDPIIPATSPPTSNLRHRHTNHLTNSPQKTRLLPRLIPEDNSICQVFSWDGHQGGCTFLTGSLATSICRMKANRIGADGEWKEGDCMEVVVGHRSDDVSGVWGGCELRRAWRIEGECRTS